MGPFERENALTRARGLRGESASVRVRVRLKDGDDGRLSAVSDLVTNENKRLSHAHSAERKVEGESGRESTPIQEEVRGSWPRLFSGHLLVY
jgi:hypothetical protein